MTQIPGGIGGAFSDIFGFDFTGYQVGFSLQIPLSNKSAQANHTRLITQKRLNESREAATAQAIATEVRDAFNQIEMNLARIEAAEIARELAVRRLDAEAAKIPPGRFGHPFRPAGTAQPDAGPNHGNQVACRLRQGRCGL